MLPANTVRQLVLQQSSILASHSQCFWVRWNPIPVLLQSVPRAVVISGVKDLIPPLMIAAILALLLSKARCCSSTHRLTHFSPALAGLSSGCMASMMDQSLWKQSTWLVSPNQLRTPVMSLGSGNSVMLHSMSSLGSTESLPRWYPGYFSCCRPKQNFSSLKVMPALEHVVK